MDMMNNAARCPHAHSDNINSSQLIKMGWKSQDRFRDEAKQFNIKNLRWLTTQSLSTCLDKYACISGIFREISAVRRLVAQ